MPRYLLAEATTGLTQLGNKWNELMENIYTVIVSITIPTAIVLCAICFLTMKTNKDQKAVDAARTWLKRIIICAVAILIIGFLATQLATYLKGANIGAGTMPTNPF